MNILRNDNMKWIFLFRLIFLPFFSLEMNILVNSVAFGFISNLPGTAQRKRVMCRKRRKEQIISVVPCHLDIVFPRTLTFGGLSWKPLSPGLLRNKFRHYQSTAISAFLLVTRRKHSTLCSQSNAAQRAYLSRLRNCALLRRQHLDFHLLWKRQFCQNWNTATSGKCGVLDKISNGFLKKCAAAISRSLTFIFNLSLSS